MHSIDYEYTDKDIIAWGGLRLVQELMERIDFRATAQNGAMGFLDDANGRTKISYVEITP